MKILLVGATGLVGSHVLRQALAHAEVDSVVAPTRKALPLSHAKLLAPEIDFDRLPEDADWWKADAVICTLGTTIAVAGSQEAFRRVDYEYPLAVARLAKQHGTPTYALNSALGANVKSSIFYSRVKGELERDLATLGFPSLTYVRPGLIGGDRPQPRRGEKVSAAVLTLFGSLMPRRWGINPAENIAQALLDSALNPKPGVNVISSDLLA